MPIFADYHRTVIGYHGTRREKALAIVSQKDDFSPSRNNYDWLGNGIYFWEYAPQQAWAWARQRYGTEPIAVVASMIRLGNCLDLLDPRNSHSLVRRHDELMAERRAGGLEPLKNARAKKYLDCEVLEYAYRVVERETGERIDTCRGVYVPGTSEGQRRLWANSWLCHNTHVQLCVRNSRCILGTWLVKPEDVEVVK